MHERIKEHARDISYMQLPQAQTSAVSEHANKTSDLRPETWKYPLWVKFIHRDPHLYCRRTKEAIQIRLHPNNCNNINRESGIGIPEEWMPTIRLNMTTDLHRSRPLSRSVSSSHNANNALDRNPPTMSEVCDTPITNNHDGTNISTQ